MTVVSIAASAEGLAGTSQVRALLADRLRDEFVSLQDRRQAMQVYAARSAHLTVEPTTVGGVPVEVHRPLHCADHGAILYAHGGAYVLGSPATHRGFAASLALMSRTAVYAVDYRLAPEHPFPAGCNDLVAVHSVLVATERSVAFAGDSAGGGLVLAGACAARDAGLRLPSALAVTSPWVDLELTGASVRANAPLDPILSPQGLFLDARRYAGELSLSAASPLQCDLQGLPAVLIQVGSDEVLLDDSRMLTTALEAAGVAVTLEVWEGMTHSWHAFGAGVPEAERALQRLAGFLAAALYGSPPNA